MAKKIEGWVRPAGIDVNGPGYELGSGCGWCEFNECGQPEHGDTKATLVIGEKAFTQSEVLAIIRSTNDLVRHGGSAIILLDSYAATKEWRNAMDRARRALKKSGIVLDPA